MNIEDKLIAVIKAIIKEKYQIESEEGMVMVEIPKDNSNGDYSTNIAMRLAKLLKRPPFQIAPEIKDELLKRVDEIEKIDIAGPGFINFWLKKDAMANVINTVIQAGNKYGHSNSGKGLKVLEEYVDAMEARGKSHRPRTENEKSGVVTDSERTKKFMAKVLAKKGIKA